MPTLTLPGIGEVQVDVYYHPAYPGSRWEEPVPEEFEATVYKNGEEITWLLSAEALRELETQFKRLVAEAA